jgi:hypothetical protein
MSRKAWLCCGLVLGVTLVGPATAHADSKSPEGYFAPVFINAPQRVLYYSHCDSASYTFIAVSAITGLQSPYVRYRLVSGPGEIDSITGEWTYYPIRDSVLIGMYTVEIAAREFFLETEGPQNCRGQFIFQNIVPFLRSSELPNPLTITPGVAAQLSLRYREFDRCDHESLTIDDITPPFSGRAEVQGGEGGGWVIRITADSADAEKQFLFSLVASDGYDSTITGLNVAVLPVPYHLEVKIATQTNQYLGTTVEVPVNLLSKIPNVGLGGFDLLFAYDNSVLSFQTATVDNSSLYSSCQWEYFTYRVGTNGNCGSSCPSGMVRAIGIAETNNGDAHPQCLPEYLPALPVELFRLQFLISSNKDYKCSWNPIRFFWVDCSDNSLISADLLSQYLADSVFERTEDRGFVSINTENPTLPGYNGVPNECLTNLQKLVPARGVHFYNGGVDINCADSLGQPTDVNDPNPALPTNFALYQNYPNPFNPTTTISFDVPRSSDVTLEVLNVLGQVVWSTRTHYNVGRHDIVWNGSTNNGSSVSSGIYYYRLRAEDIVQTRKMILLK